MNIGETIEAALIQAQDENRLITGLNNVSKHLRETECPEHSLFFFIAPSPAGDSISHMQEVVLQSFCFENDIYIIKLDCAGKLNAILRCDFGVTCALMQIMSQQQRDEEKREKYTELESVLIDHCEDFWDEVIQPIIRLPEK